MVYKMHGTIADGVHLHGAVVNGVKMHVTRADGVHTHGTIVKGIKGARYQSGMCECAWYHFEGSERCMVPERKV
jgi:hypothetical protein